MHDYLETLACGACDREHDARHIHTVCERCGHSLLARYDLSRVSRAVTPVEVAHRPRGIWRFRELLPPVAGSEGGNLGAGDTPLLPLRRLGRRLGMSNLWLKDEGANPTGTFKARGAAVGVAAAAALGVRELAIPTAGNAGSAWAAYSAAYGLPIHVVMPVDTPPPIKAECVAYGADVTEVDGLISDAAGIVGERAARHGWFDASTMREPYRVEGKKTMGLEIAEAFDWKPPDAVLYPTGGGVGLIGIWKAMRELDEMGWLEGPPPRLIAVQAAGCASIVDAWDAGAATAERVADAHTIAPGLRVPLPFAHALVLRAIRETGGTAVAVSDDELVAAMSELAESEGVFACPEGAALLPALRRLLERGDLTRDQTVVLLNTGNALKYTDLMQAPRGSAA
ncbi:MAG: threonine synthase [Chloroflexota bacterium]|nr:threonine synthase [Chloroflexota bacterium]